MEHSFDIDFANEHGIMCAIIYKHILFWIAKNKAHNKNFKDGSYWTYFSVSSLESLFPYMTEKQIRTSIDKLKEKNIIKSSNFNPNKYDRTCWYAFVNEPEDLKKIKPKEEKGKSICPTGQMEMPSEENGCANKGEPIPYNITDIEKKDNKTNTLLPERKKTPQAILVEYFSMQYYDMTQIKYLAKNSDYTIMAKLIKDYGQELVKQKIDWLKTGIVHSVFWFAKNIGDFTIGKLKSQWNNILPQYTDKQRKEIEQKKEEEEQRRRVMENVREFGISQRRER